MRILSFAWSMCIYEYNNILKNGIVYFYDGQKGRIPEQKLKRYAFLFTLKLMTNVNKTTVLRIKHRTKIKE